MKENKHSAIWFLLGLTISFISVYFIAKNIDVIKRFIDSMGVFGPLVSILIYGAFSVTPIPTDPLTVINGAIFGPVLGILTSWWGNNFAAFLEYFLGKRIRDLTNFEKMRKNLPFGIGKLPVDSVGFLLGGRFVPQFGGKMVSLMGGMYGVSLKRYMWTACVSNLLGSIMFALGGWGFIKTIHL